MYPKKVQRTILSSFYVHKEDLSFDLNHRMSDFTKETDSSEGVCVSEPLERRQTVQSPRWYTC